MNQGQGIDIIIKNNKELVDKSLKLEIQVDKLLKENTELLNKIEIYKASLEGFADGLCEATAKRQIREEELINVLELAINGLIDQTAIKRKCIEVLNKYK